MGRPTTFDEQVASGILERLSGGTPLAEICRDEGMPHPSTFRRWCDTGEHELNGVPLAIAYAQAREDGFDALAAEALQIANTPCEGEIVTDDGEKVTTKREDMLGHRKLQVETRLKLLAKWDPKRYGDLVKLSGADGESPIPIVSIKGEMTPQQATEAYTKLLGS